MTGNDIPGNPETDPVSMQQLRPLHQHKGIKAIFLETLEFLSKFLCGRLASLEGHLFPSTCKISLQVQLLDHHLNLHGRGPTGLANTPQESTLKRAPESSAVWRDSSRET